MSRRNNSGTDERREKKQRTYNIDSATTGRDDRMAEVRRTAAIDGSFRAQGWALHSCPESRGRPSPCVRCGCAESKRLVLGRQRLWCWGVPFWGGAMQLIDHLNPVCRQRGPCIRVTPMLAGERNDRDYTKATRPIAVTCWDGSKES